MRIKHFILLAVLGVAVLVTMYWLHSPLESDAYLAANFARHEEHFRRIAQMMEEDKNGETIGLEYVRLKEGIWDANNLSGLSPKRRSEYLKLFELLGDEKVFSVSREQGMIVISIAVVADSPINENERWVMSKAYVYSKSEPSALVESLDWNGFNSDSPKYKRIGENW